MGKHLAATPVTPLGELKEHAKSYREAGRDHPLLPGSEGELPPGGARGASQAFERIARGEGGGLAYPIR